MKFLRGGSTYLMLRIPLLLLIGMALLSATAYGQGKASIVGTVTDPSGAVIPGVSIKVTNTGTGAARGAAAFQVTRASGWFGGEHQLWFASVLRFCTIAARWNSSRAPERPLSRMRSKR